jgi:hypothetical protein
VEKPGAEQFRDDEAHAPGGVKGVHVRAAARVDTRQQGRDAGEIVHILPVDQYAGGARDGGEVDGVVGAAAGGEQADDGVDEGAFIEDAAQRLFGVAGVGDEPVDGGAGEGLARGRAGVDEAGAGQLQAHHFEQHLV